MNKCLKNEEAEHCAAFSTRIINAGFEKPDVYGAINQPVYRNASFEFPDSETIAAAFQHRADLHTYSRISNPTVANFEKKIKAASGAENVIALASGMAAISNTFWAVTCAGSNIIASPHLFGNTFSFLKSTLSSFGVEVRFVDVDDLQQIAAAIDDNTCAFFAEIITNPHLEVADLPEISKILKNKNIPMIIDTTVIPWCGFDAKKAGIDVEVISTTKYISGGATSIGGAIVDYGIYDWKANQKLGILPKPKGMSRFTFKLRSEIVRNLGACMSPDTAYLQSLGMESLQLRYEQMSRTAYGLALYLSEHPKVVNVNYPKLDCSPYKAVSEKLFKGNPGAMFTISLKSKPDCYKFMDALKIIRRATNLFDNKTLVIHPESTIFGTFPPEIKKFMGVEDNLVRFSVGLEDIEDLKQDINNGLDVI
ncbi:MAG: PLP-dependent transferase [Candidatus Azobacteroides sp.]|nr:PLP-dependent transferase [Candidatus Azobacteroides sp.]